RLSGHTWPVRRRADCVGDPRHRAGGAAVAAAGGSPAGRRSGRAVASRQIDPAVGLARLPATQDATRRASRVKRRLRLAPRSGRIGLAGCWRGESPGRPSPAASVSPEATYLLAAELSNHLPIYTWGDQARIAIRALILGDGLGATIHADSLE